MKPLVYAAGALLLALLPRPAAARTVDSGDDAAFAAGGRLFRFDYANDFFAGRDRYYTQGFGFTLFHPVLAESPVTRLLAALPGGESSYGLRFRHSGFTPTSLASDAALAGDRPFAAYMFLSQVRVSRDPDRGLSLTAGLDAGILGQGAGGKWIQTGLHRALGNLLPHGWETQVRNDAVLDYHALLEKRLVGARRGEAGAFLDAAAGSPYTNAAVGLMGRAGPFFARGQERLVGYDATLQGGLFNRHSPYTLRAAQVERVVYGAEVGVVLDRGGFALRFSRSFLGREFRGGLAHQWGELSLLARF